MIIENMKEMQRLIFKTALDHGWWPMQPVSVPNEELTYETKIDLTRVSIPEKIALMHSELSEALEFYRTDQMETFDCYITNDPINPKPDGFWVELADCMIRIMDLAEAYGEDMSELITRKMAYNQSRSYRHGGKKC